MPLNTDLSVAPYHDDFDESKKYARILFTPNTSVQTREINQLQTIIQNQVGRIADNLFENGTIIEGCNFSFYPSYQYCKISDISSEGIPSDVSSYAGLYVKNDSNLTAHITNTLDGFESQNVKKTLFLNYINSSDTYDQDQFSSGDVLTIYSSNNALFGFNIYNGGTQFSNSDLVVITPAVSVKMTTGTFVNGEILTCPSTNAKAQVVEVQSNGVAYTLNLKPRSVDLSNSSSNSSFWTFNAGDILVNGSNSAVATIKSVYGSGAKAEIITDIVGTINDCYLIDQGKSYTIVPTVSIRSSNNASVGTANLVAKNYLSKVSVLSSPDAVGTGYAFGVDEGIIYQKGFPLKVDQQLVVVDPYSSSPNNVVVGFVTQENIITSDIDESLLDNSNGFDNEFAPGAHRLQLVPLLTVLSVDEAENNTEFLDLVEWNDGNPYKKTPSTVYSRIGDAMATRTFDASGDFVLDQFQVTTDSIANAQQEGLYYTLVVDPGAAYVQGQKTVTLRNYRKDISKGLDVGIANNQKISLNYESYVRINEVGGLFQFSTGDTVDLYDTPKKYASNISLISTGNTSPQGNKIGTARIRSMILENGIAGVSNTTYRLFLFGINMNSGSNFKNVKSIYYNGTYKGISDVILDLDPITSANISQLHATQDDSLIFNAGVESLKNANNITYIYRTIDQTAATANNGTLTKSIASTPSEFFPYSGNLSDSEMKELYVVPLANNLIAYTPFTGNVSVNTTSANVIGTGTTFITDIQAGDYVYLTANATTQSINRVLNVVNNTLLILDSNVSFANASSSNYRIFPKNIPVPFGSRSGLTANVNSNGNILTLNFGVSFNTSTTVNTAIGVNIQRTNVTPAVKTANRNQFVKLSLANNADGISGPWCLGVSDVFRLKNVYIGSNSSVNTSSTNVTSDFYVDNNQLDNYLDLSYLYKNPKSSLSLSSSDWLLVQFDYFTSTAGMYNTVSYTHTANAAQIAALDSTLLANLSSAAASFEVPEVYTSKGNYYDLLNCFDFRPAVVNTVAVTANASTAPVNPVYTLSFGNTADPTNDKKFPLPDSICSADIEHYLGRTDAIILDRKQNISVLKGSPSADPVKRYIANIPSQAMLLQEVKVPAYPNITKYTSNNVFDLINTRVANEQFSIRRLIDHTIEPILTPGTVEKLQPKGYSMADIGNIDRRVQALEYYQSLSILETSLSSKIVPSSIDPSLNRFKYGFFVDDFSTKIYSALTDPQYAASIEPKGQPIFSNNTLPQLSTNLLVPPKFTWALQHSAPQINQSYIDWSLIKQGKATSPAPKCSAGPEYIVSNTSSSIVNTYSFFSVSAGHGVGSTQNKHLILPNTSGPCVLYLYISTHATSSSSTYFAYDDPIFTVYQNGTVLVDSSSAIAMSNNDYDNLASNPYTGNFFWAADNTRADLIRDGIHLYNGGAKIEFYHDASKGTSYDIRVEFPPETYYQTVYTQTIDYSVTSQSLSNWLSAGNQLGGGGTDAGYENARFITTSATSVTLDSVQWLLTYPIEKSEYQVIVSDPCSNAAPATYNGRIVTSKNFNLGLRGTHDFIEIGCFGLKPLTEHTLFIDGIVEKNYIKQVGKNFGDPLVTAIDGSMSLEFYIPDSWYTKYQNNIIPFTTQFNNAVENADTSFVSTFIDFDLVSASSSASAKVTVSK